MHMKSKEIIISGLISLIPACFIFLDVADLKQVYEDPEAYPFGSAFVSSDSIYTSETTYVLYKLFFDAFLLLLIYFSFRPRRKLYFVVLFLAILVFLYPIFTASA